jgi:sigma-B regulation protein RsbU (phosphoserine phosphatase)
MDAYLDQAPCLCFAIRDDGTVAGINDAFCTRTGYTSEEVISRKSDFLFTISTRIFQQTHLLPLLKMQGYAEEIYMTLQAKDGQRLPVLINAERKTTGAEAVTIYAGIIVHNRKKFEDELVAAKKAAEAALHENTNLQQAKNELQAYAEQMDRQMDLITKQNEELRQFNRVVTHDLQEPVRKLLIFSDMMQGTTDAKTGMEAIERVRKVSQQMHAVLSGLQQYVWLTEASIHPTLAAIDALLPEVTQQLETEFPGVTLSITKEEIPPIEADQDQMQFLLHQLLSNAVQFRKQGDNVQIQILADTLLLNKFRKVEGKYAYKPFLKLQIRDKGIGFDPVYKEQVFGLFRRLHPESGRGIGLSLCRKIVENHHGTITIDTKKGEGTTVCITLPVQQEERGSDESVTTEVPGKNGNRQY